MTLQKIKEQIKKYFSPIFDPQKRESGLVVAALVVTGIIALISGVGWYFKAQIAREILYGSGSLMLGLARFFFKMTQGLFETVASSDILQRSITRDAMVLHGWAIVRDFANMFIVLGFVVVGIATILRIRTYEAQKTLLPLILVALLINFSLLICGIIIDTTNITMNYFTKISGPAGITTQYGALLTDPRIDNQLQTFKNTSEWENYASMCFATAIYIAIAAMIFFIYGILLLFRYVALMLLVILSPLAFVCYVFPATQSIFSKWWQQFTQWAIIGIPTAFFIYLGGHLLQSMANQNNSVIAYWVPVGFLLFAYTLIFQTSAIGASAAIGMATGAAGFAWGRTKGAVKFGGKQAWDSRAGQATRRGLTMAGEKMGVIAPGTANLARQKQQQEHDSEKRAGTWSAEQRKELATGRTPMTRRGRNDKIEAGKQMALKGELGSLSQDERDHVMNYTASHGVPASVLAKGDYNAAEYDKGRVQKVITSRGLVGPTAEADAKKIVRQEQLAQNLPSMTDEQRRNIHHTDIEGPANYDFVKENFTPHMFSQLQTATDPLLRSGMRGHLGQIATDIGSATSTAEKTRLQKLHDAIDKYC